MYEKFENLIREKKERILNACIEEFSRNSYKTASTNNIVERAGISKGILFHYFGNKKSLFLYVYDYCLDFVNRQVMEQLNGYIRNNEGDIFGILMQTGLIKMQVAKSHPDIYAVLFNALHSIGEIKADMQSRFEKVYKEYMEFVLSNMDASKFRKGIDMNKAVELLIYALDGVSSKYLKLFKDMPASEIFSKADIISKEYYEYIDILRGGMYG